MNKKQNIIIKISGASLKSSDDIYNKKSIDNLVEQIKEIQKEYNIAIVIGGGNIFRGCFCKEFNLDRNDADYMGMLATCMNGILLQNVLNNNGIKAQNFSAVAMEAISYTFNVKKVKETLAKEVICILSGGTGSPFFTTDTGVALRAAQLDAKTILMGKNDTDGVYNKDPNKYKDAKHFATLKYSEIIEMKLDVMDKTALTMCEENNIDLIVFNIDEPNSIVNAIKKKNKFTVITK